MNLDFRPFYEEGMFESYEMEGVESEVFAPDGIVLHVTSVRGYNPGDAMKLRVFNTKHFSVIPGGTPVAAPYKLVKNMHYELTLNLKLIQDLPHGVYCYVESSNEAKMNGIFVYSPYYRRASEGYIRASLFSPTPLVLEQFYPLARLRFAKDITLLESTAEKPEKEEKPKKARKPRKQKTEVPKEPEAVETPPETPTEVPTENVTGTDLLARPENDTQKDKDASESQ